MAPRDRNSRTRERANSASLSQGSRMGSARGVSTIQVIRRAKPLTFTSFQGRMERNKLQSARSNRSLSNLKQNRRSNTSLWSAKREKELKERDVANRKQLARLQDTKCSFDVIKWTKQEKKRQKLLDNIRQYPEKPIREVENRPPLKKAYRQRSVLNSGIYNSVSGSPTRQTFTNRLPNVPTRGDTPGSRGKGFKSVLPPPRPSKNMNNNQSSTHYPSVPRGRFTNSR